MFRYYRDKLHICNKGCFKIRKIVKGQGNCLEIGENSYLDNTVIRIIGNNNKIFFDKNVSVGPDCSFWIEGNNISITVGSGTTFTKTCHINAQEDESSIKIGKDCMFSNNIIVRTSDSHGIFDTNTGTRLNPAKPVIIGNHVWIAPQTIIMKGAYINDNVIVGSRTLVTKTIPSNSLLVGSPAKVVKENVTWSREDIIFKKQ